MTNRIERVAVLGGSGFIGHAVVEELLRHGYSLTTVNRMRTSAAYSGPVDRIAADRRDASSYARALAAVDADCVIDVTAYRPDETRIAIDAFRGRVARFVHISTLSVYRWPFPCPIAEDWPLEPDAHNGYGFQKAGCESLIHSEPVAALAWTILRLPAVIGPRDPCSREDRLRQQIAADLHVTVPMRPFLCQNIFVRDAARAVRMLIENPATTGRAYNAGSPPFTLEDYVALLARLLGKEPRMMRASARVLAQGGTEPADVPYFFEGDLVLDTRRIRDDAAFEPGYGMKQSLVLTLEWLSRNEPADGSACAEGGAS